MTYEALSPFFWGMVVAMFLANSIQWFMYRERIYGLYTIYTLIWAFYFVINHLGLPTNLGSFFKLSSYLGYIFYLELAKIFLNLRERPRFLRSVVVVQWMLVFYCAVKTYVYLFTDFWQSTMHTILLQPIRFAMLAVGGYIVFSFFRSKDVVARFFVAGTASLLINHAITAALLIHSPNLSLSLPFWQHPDLFLQVGVVLDLIFFSLGISYRHRREAVRKAVVEKDLEREREQRHRENLEADLAIQRMQHEKTEVQMRALQSQVNPHFLFNGLNTLSSLIDESPGQASKFVDELSNVYRYLLRSNENELVTLSDELRFIRSYFHLLQTRFGTSVDLQVSVTEEYQKALLPPLTLQLLVENAVKHNVVLPDQPLRIRIRTSSQDLLIVENNLQRKNLRIESNGVGLSNIDTKYRLLNQPTPLVGEADGWFQVILVLINLPQTQTARPVGHGYE
ncbi:sensor histidine kinase [Larkinella insperata]|uniref:Sensor histidine kinase n=1 Tax=Larkinella insperata TaxID=332158 RepID=A0ABW3Q9R7_9BACT|nr:histidine kinase [Larkinella insperata]